MFKKIIVVILLVISIMFTKTYFCIYACPNNALNNEVLAEHLLLKIQNSEITEEELNKLFNYLEILNSENTQFFAYNIEKLNILMEKYCENIINNARSLAQNKKYKEAVNYLESKKSYFTNKSTVTSLINHYTQFFIEEGLVLCDIKPIFLSVNKLLAYPENAFNNKNSEELDNLYLTNKEFYNLLNELYLNDYILINLTDYLDLSSNEITKKELYLPENKKPIILMYNNANYNNEEYFIEKFIIDAYENPACFSSTQCEKQQISYNTDFIPILEDFIENNKDFSFKNAKAIVSFENYNNILGYNINKSNPNYNQEILNLKKIAEFLKAKNYNFSFGDFTKNFNSLSNDDFLNEVNYFNNELTNIFGKIKIFTSNYNTPKLSNIYYELNKLGIKVFINFNISNCLIKNNCALISFEKINGEILRNKTSPLNINYDKIYDHNTRVKLFDA